MRRPQYMQCPTCGASRDATVTRGPLVVHREPLRVEFRGAPLDLTRTQASIVEKLARFGHAAFELLEGDAGRKVLRVHIANLRRLLPDDIRIEPIFGWGYKLVVAP